MTKSGCKPGMLVLIVLLAWLGTLPLASAQLAARADAAPCHRSMPVPNSPESQPTDHSCCAIGHGSVLLSGKLEIVSLQAGDVSTLVAAPPTSVAVDPGKTPILYSHPSLRSNLPIRI